MFTIRYSTYIPDDIATIPTTTRARIKKAIETKLTTKPEVFGKPLRHSLLGFRSLRIGEYRTIYLIRKSEVLILVIAHRKHVYDIADKRT